MNTIIFVVFFFMLVTGDIFFSIWKLKNDFYSVLIYFEQETDGDLPIISLSVFEKSDVGKLKILEKVQNEYIKVRFIRFIKFFSYEKYITWEDKFNRLKTDGHDDYRLSKTTNPKIKSGLKIVIDNDDIIFSESERKIYI